MSQAEQTGASAMTTEELQSQAAESLRVLFELIEKLSLENTDPQATLRLSELVRTGADVLENVRVLLKHFAAASHNIANSAADAVLAVEADRQTIIRLQRAVMRTPQNAAVRQELDAFLRQLVLDADASERGALLN